MQWVVFLRAVNVGKHNRFQPGVLAKELSHLGFVNVGAVGTFVVRKATSASALRTALLAKLPVKCEMMICRAKVIVELVRTAPFTGEMFDNDRRGFVTVLAKAPADMPKLPIYAPDVKNWEVKIVQINGICVVSLWRRLRENALYPNQVIEKKFALAATTRSWNTILKVGELLQL
ncbi:MAG: hypothetical protein QOG67_2153 [Verrucomicrobiota bacterium]|jgi:uncharacterized protein (DUF1697 family)